MEETLQVGHRIINLPSHNARCRVVVAVGGETVRAPKGDVNKVVGEVTVREVISGYVDLHFNEPGVVIVKY